MKTCFLKVCTVVILLLLSLTLVFSATAATESEGTEKDDIEIPPVVSDEKSPYNLYVGGVAVTEENKDNIFSVETSTESENPNGTKPIPAVYDADNRVLTLRGTYEMIGFVTMEEVNYSILSLGEESVDVVIAEGASLTFRNGIYIQNGDFTANDSSRLKFAGSVEGSAAFVQIVTGALKFYKSHVECLSTDGITKMSDTVDTTEMPDGVGFAADTISMEGTRVNIDSEPFALPLHALFYADKDLKMSEDSLIMINSVGYLADTLFFCGSSCTISDGFLIVEGIGCLFDLPKADLTISHCKIMGSATFGMILGGETTIDRDTSIDLKTICGGIIANGEEGGFYADGATLCFAYDMTVVDSKYRVHRWDDVENIAFYADGIEVQFSDCTITFADYSFGIFYISRGEQLAFTGNLMLTAEDAAFFALTVAERDVYLGTETTGDAYISSVFMEDALGDLGKYAIALVPYDAKLESIYGVSVEKPADVLDAFTGYITECNLTVKEFPAAAVVIPCVVILTLTIGSVALYQGGFVLTGKRKKNRAAAESDAADASAEATEPTEPVTDTEAETDEETNTDEEK